MQIERDLFVKAFLGDEEAQYQLGLKYFNNKSEKEAVFWLKRAMEKTHLKAIELLQEINTKNYFLKRRTINKKRKKACQSKTTTPGI